MIQTEQLWKEWPVAGPWQVSALEGGTNNSIWQVETRARQKYVLRIVSGLTSATYLH